MCIQHTRPEAQTDGRLPSELHQSDSTPDPTSPYGRASLPSKGATFAISVMLRRPSHTYSPQRSRHSSRTRMRGAGQRCPACHSGLPSGAIPGSRKAGCPGVREENEAAPELRKRKDSVGRGVRVGKLSLHQWNCTASQTSLNQQRRTSAEHAARNDSATSADCTVVTELRGQCVANATPLCTRIWRSHDWGHNAARGM